MNQIITVMSSQRTPEKCVDTTLPQHYQIDGILFNTKFYRHLKQNSNCRFQFASKIISKLLASAHNKQIGIYCTDQNPYYSAS